MLRLTVSRDQQLSRSRDNRVSVDRSARRIEVVIPFTTVRQVQLGLRQAEQLCCGLDAIAHVIRVVVVPFPLDLDRPAISLTAAERQMASLRCHLPMTLTLTLSRDLLQGMISAVPEQPLFVLVSKRRFWRTKEQKLARSLRCAGFEVLLSYEVNEDA
jgi:hypothetical protein